MTLATTPRRRFTFRLEPIAGRRFQPTGFPDLGAALYKVPGEDSREDLLVESSQSMANHLEGTTWDIATCQPADAVAALPYVRVVNPDGEFLTSSRLEAHRLASAYVLKGKLDGTEMSSVLPERFGLVKGKPLDMARVYQQIFALDPLSLVHGVFFAQKWPWQPKVARAITAFIEAEDALPAVSGGVKKDSVNNEAEKGGRDAKEGYGMVPHHRTEYTAQDITLYVVIDEQQLTSYGLSETATELLSAVAHWELATVLASGLRLRTACDFVVVGGDAVPDLTAASERLAQAVEAASDELAPVTEVVFS